MSLVLEEEEEVDEPIVINGATTSNSSSSSTAAATVLELAGEEDEVDEPLPFQPSVQESAEIVACSAEYTDAVEGITSDCWDINSWMIYLEEVEQGKGGSTGLSDAYNRFLSQFPMSATVWKKLVNHYTEKGQWKSCEETLDKCLVKCRSVSLWRSYLTVKKINTIDKISNVPSQVEQYMQARSSYETAFDKAIENVGFSIDSFDIWRAYIDFVKTWGEQSMVEAIKKTAGLRKLYQRALCTPMEGAVDHLWNEYEAFEKTNGDPTSLDQQLQDLNRKFLHAKSICRERKRMVTSIVFDRLAVPPTNSSAEMNQLGQWNDWIRFEMGNPDNLSPNLLKDILRLVYGQCLCCFR